jgi:hypothetical protein
MQTARCNCCSRCRAFGVSALTVIKHTMQMLEVSDFGVNAGSTGPLGVDIRHPRVV